MRRTDKRIPGQNEWQVIDTENNACRGWWDTETNAYIDNENGVGVSVLWRPSRRKVQK